MSSPIKKTVELNNTIKSVYKFLHWKITTKHGVFTQDDKDIISKREFENFHRLSNDSCKYSKVMMRKYTELLWADSLRNEFLCDGHSNIPKPSCAPLALHTNISRKSEVMLMSMFHENNLLNSFLCKINRPEAPSALCHCGEEEQTPYHVILRCEKVDLELRERAMDRIQLAGEEGENTIVLLNLSRDKEFMECLTEIITIQKDFLSDTIQLD